MSLYSPPPEVDEIAGISFNGINTVKDKTAYGINTGCAGVMIWELSHDTQDSTSLLNAIDEEVGEVIEASFDKVLIWPSKLSATASTGYSTYPDPQVVVDGTGMVSLMEHSYSRGSWFTTTDDQDRWIVVDLDGRYILEEVHVWNANEWYDWHFLGFNEAAFYVADMSNPGNPVDNPDNWTLVTTVVLTEALGTTGYNSPDIVNLLGLTGTHAALRCVQPTLKYGDLRAGLSELQFYSVGLRADLDDDNDVDMFDLRIFADNWLGAGQYLKADVNRDGEVNIVDLSVFDEEWLLGID